VLEAYGEGNRLTVPRPQGQEAVEQGLDEPDRSRCEDRENEGRDDAFRQQDRARGRPRYQRRRDGAMMSGQTLKDTAKNKKRRIVAHLYGGLGNQLFIFAAAWTLARRNSAELCLDASGFWRDSLFRRKFALNNFEGIKNLKFQKFFILDIIAKIYSKLIGMFSFLPSKLGPLLCEGSGQQMKFDNEWNRSNLSSNSTLHVFGYRQNEDYFKEYTSELRELLTLTFQPSPALYQFSKTIQAVEAVSVSFRRQFGVKLNKTALIPQIDTLDAEYYHKAVSKICEMITSPVFLCFGDSLDDVDALLPSDIKRIIPPRTPDLPSDIRDFWLMLQCRHFIIANSTFSWWAAWLGQRSGAVVTCPDVCGLINQVAPASGWHVIRGISQNSCLSQFMRV